jgi:hypothetical protein
MPMTEIGQFFKRSGKAIVGLIVQEILDDEHVQKI